MKRVFCIFLIPSLFFIFSLITIKDYGISWDEPAHFFRGQAFLNFFLTGNRNFSNLRDSPRLSYYQEPSLTAEYFLKVDGGHPPLNGILSSLTNYMFYQRLPIMGDIESYHLFSILCSTFLVLMVIIFTTYNYGLFAGLVAGLALSTYPLFFSEGHFNIKDPPEAFFYTATILTFWQAIRSSSWRWLLASSLLFGSGLSIKFNILFLPFILIPWYFAYILQNTDGIFNYFTKLPKRFIFILLIYPLVGLLIFFGSWPYLWQDPINNTLSVIRYYRDIGTGSGQADYHIFKELNLFPITWIIFTTPPLVLFFAFFGISAIILKRLRGIHQANLLILLWLTVPIARVTMPGSSIYGGIRQIMEFIPALCIIAGIGATLLIKILTNIFRTRHHLILAVQIVLLFAFIPHILIMVKLHPNQNVYFNSLIGGIKGAQQSNIPYWGNSFGNAYLQAVNWLNQNTPYDSRVGLVQGTATNIPKIYFRSDIQFSNSFWSGIDRRGEYLLDLTHQGYQQAYPFVWDYVNTVLVPVHEVQVDGVAIAKIWKNDIAHSRPRYLNTVDVRIDHSTVKNNTLELTFQKQYALAKLNLEFISSRGCAKINSGFIETSIDGIKWYQEPEKIGDEQVHSYPSIDYNKITFIFPAREARYLRIIVDNIRSCVFQNTKVNIQGFD